MDAFLARDLAYVIRLDEIGWGGVLLALSIAIHIIGTLQILRATLALTQRTQKVRTRFPGIRMGVIILAVWMIVSVHLLEIAVWAGFFVWKDAQPNIFSAFYNAMLNYSTLQAGYLPLRWRLLEGMLGMTGLLTFAWSTATLYSLAAKYIEEALKPLQES
jgi:hypothetical protein